MSWGNLFSNWVYSVGDAVLSLTDTGRHKLEYKDTGIIVKIWESAQTKTKMYDVLLEDGSLKARMHQHLQPVINRQDGVDSNG